MPELPEIVAHAERLHREFAGATLERFDPLTFTALKTATPAPAEVAGDTLVGVGHRGKHLLLELAAATFVVHLMQGGRLRPDAKQAARPRNGLARWTFADGRALLLTEAGKERKAGVWLVAGDPASQAPLDGLGPDADTVDRTTLAALLAEHPMRLHGFLRDQHALAGVGRRLANEVCHRARLSPFAATAKLAGDDIDRLRDALHACIEDSLATERARDDMSSSAERPSAVHHHRGDPCPVCGDTVRAVEYRAYEVDYCPTCQTGGRILADNTTSRFLK